MISAVGSVGEENETLAYLLNGNASLGGGSGGGVVVGPGHTAHQAASAANQTANVTSEAPVFPGYVRTASMVFCIVILGIGVVGNVMVPLVIMKTKDMRNSTNIFLMNLSIADLMVLLVCTPTVLVEVNSKPETWVLGEEMCKAVPFIELTVAHASVLTILAISFERYYAICEPLRAGYVCTKTRAILICLMAWAFAALFTSPITVLSEYRMLEYIDGSMVPVCRTMDSFWTTFFFVMIISIFFLFPVGVLIVLYAVIAHHLMADPGTLSSGSGSGEACNQRARKQVVLMLGTVVLSFFLCLLPFRVFTLWIIIVPKESIDRLGAERYYVILYFCRAMLYLNSAVNPILYNLMSSKFRIGFRRLVGLRRGGRNLLLNRDRPTLTTRLSHSSGRFRGSPELSWRRASSDSRQRNGSIRRNVILRSSLLLRENVPAKPGPEPPQNPESYV